MIKIQNPKRKIRVRIAPSPTGFLHIGTARTALFNYLFAKKYRGVFIVRIEDTDLERSNPEFEKNILDGLKWLGLQWNEGPTFSQKENVGIKNYSGEYGPYRQSGRIENYAKYIQQLLDDGKAYHCFCTEEDLEAQRQEMMARGVAPKYSGKCASLSRKESKKLLDAGKPSVIRFRMPPKKSSFQDLINGQIEFDTDLIGDIVIARQNFVPQNLGGQVKNFYTPLYNFAVVVDDFEMQISHVIRGGDHISNTPKQLMLQEALNFPKPEYAHLPLILGPDKTKLSKRHGSTAISDYCEQGYLPEALINFMVLMGWNPGNEREIFSLEELQREFSFEQINKSPAMFNVEKLDWFNGYYIKHKSLDELTLLCIPYLEKLGFIARETISETTKKFRILETNDMVSFKWLKRVVALEQERMKKGIDRLPRSLGDALEELKEDAVIKNALEPLTPKYLKLRGEEWHEYSYRVHEWERQRYLEESFTRFGEFRESGIKVLI